MISALWQRGTRASREFPNITVQGLICSEESWQRRCAPQRSSCCSSSGAASGGLRGPAVKKKLRHNQHYMRPRSCVCVRVCICFILIFSFFHHRLSISSENSCSYLCKEILPIIFSIAWLQRGDRPAAIHSSSPAVWASGQLGCWARGMGEFPGSELQEEKRDWTGVC